MRAAVPVPTAVCDPESGKVVAYRYEDGQEWPVIDRWQAKLTASRQQGVSQIQQARIACWPVKYGELKDWTFARLDDDFDADAIEMAARAAERIAGGERDGLILFGAQGTGKSTLAACVCNALVDAGRRCKFTSVYDIMVDAKEIGERNALGKLRGMDLVVLDDFGTEATTDHRIEQSFRIVDALCGAGRNLLVTTSLGYRQIVQPSQRMHGVMGRIRAKCSPVEVKGPDRRQVRANG